MSVLSIHIMPYNKQSLVLYCHPTLLKDNCKPTDTTKSFGETVRGIREMDLNDKLFRLKNVEGLQDTEANQDDSELKVRRYYYHLNQHNGFYLNIIICLSLIYL